MDWTPHMISNVTTILANRLRALPDPSERWNRAQRDEIERVQRDLVNLGAEMLNEIRRLRRATPAAGEAERGGSE